MRRLFAAVPIMLAMAGCSRPAPVAVTPAPTPAVVPPPAVAPVTLSRAAAPPDSGQFYRDRDGDLERVRPGMTPQKEEQSQAASAQRDRAARQQDADIKAHPAAARARIEELKHEQWEIGVRVMDVQNAMNAVRSDHDTWSALRQKQIAISAEAAPLAQEQRRLQSLIGP